jgi:hypothetical protein
MNSKDLLQLGVPPGDALKRAHEFILAFRDSGGDMSQLESEVAASGGEPSGVSRRLAAGGVCSRALPAGVQAT